MLARRRLDEVTPKDTTAIKLASKSHTTMSELLKAFGLIKRAIAEKEY